MNPVKVKICGLTTLNDAEAAVRYGADAVGFVFAESKRQVKPKQVWGITKNLPVFTLKVGVFMDEGVERVMDIAHYCNLDAVQLHGAETLNYCKKVASSFKLIKTVKINNSIPSVHLNTYNKYQLLLESACTSGGSGKTWDWDRLPKKYRNHSVILSGGLTPSNVQRAISIVNPIAVDVASGVESKPGIKDHVLIKNFITKAKGISL